MFAQYKESENAPVLTAIVVGRPNPARADLQVFSDNQNGSELKLNVPIYQDGDVTLLPCCRLVEPHEATAAGSDGVGHVTVASLNHEVQQLREIILRLERAIKPKEPVAVSEELGRESEVGE